MAKKFESFHPRVIIDEHFDELINRIDLNTEEIFHEKNTIGNNQIVRTHLENDELNELRQRQIQKLKEVNEINLKQFQNFNDEEFEKKWSSVIDNVSLRYEEKLDRIKEEIVSIDCILLENSSKSLVSVGSILTQKPNCINLWITDWFYNLENLKFLK